MILVGFDADGREVARAPLAEWIRSNMTDAGVVAALKRVASGFSLNYWSKNINGPEKTTCSTS